MRNNVPEKCPMKRPAKSVEEATSEILQAMGARGSRKDKSHSRKDKSNKCVKSIKTDRIVKQEPNPSWSNERSRSQVLFRTGLKGPGQSSTIKYSNKATEVKAIKEAKRKVDAEMIRRGLK